MPTDFLTGLELRDRLGELIDRAAELKAGRPAAGADSLAGRSVALIFEKPSTRTRVSFEVGVAELGGTPIVLRSDEMQISRGESIADVGRVLSRFVHCIAMRSGSDERVVELAEAADVPVINALTPLHHPCQAIADLQTLKERFGSLEGLRVAFVGDGNNVARSLALLGREAGVEVVVSSPPGYELEGDAGAELIGDPAEAVAGADAIYADVWFSMGDDEAEMESKREAFDAVPDRRRPARRRRATARSSSTASPPIPARRSPPTSSTASARRSSTRPRTACTPRRRCWRCCSSIAPGTGRRASWRLVDPEYS